MLKKQSSQHPYVTGQIGQELRVSRITYVTDVSMVSAGDEIPLGLIAQVRMGDHVGLATAIRARLSDTELTRVGSLSRAELADPNQTFKPIFEDVAASPEKFGLLPVQFSGCLRFSSIMTEVRAISARLEDVPLEQYLLDAKREVSHILAARFSKLLNSDEAFAASVASKSMPRAQKRLDQNPRSTAQNKVEQHREQGSIMSVQESTYPSNQAAVYS